MKTIDRVMKAYLSKRTLSDAQREFVYADLSNFINDLRSGKTIPGHNSRLTEIKGERHDLSGLS
jgi:hypothetical protein